MNTTAAATLSTPFSGGGGMLCDCPVGFMGRLGYLWCVPCSTASGKDRDVAFEPVLIRNLDNGEECCTTCNERLVPEYLR